jgi:hypothetical protein
MRINQNTGDYFEIADRDDLGYDEKLERYAQLADAYFQRDEFEEFRETALPELPRVVLEYVESADFEELAERAIRLEVEPERQDEMIDRCLTLTSAWARDERTLGSRHR